jgi:uncharacterized protein (TIGR02246 family)
VISLGFGFGTRIAASEAMTQDTAQDSAAGLDRLREALHDAYNRGDVEAMASYLHPDGVIIFPDGSILKGRDAFRDYYNRMLKGPDARVSSYSAEPVIESRTVHNDVGLSYGYMNDKYVLNDGQSFNLNSRFTVTVFQSPTGPAETGGWMIRSFHSSPDTFDNPILTLVARAVFWRAGIGGAVAGLVLGLALGALFFRRKRKTATN